MYSRRHHHERKKASHRLRLNIQKKKIYKVPVSIIYYELLKFVFKKSGNASIKIWVKDLNRYFRNKVIIVNKHQKRESANKSAQYH